MNVREVLNGLLYVLSTGCQWRALPKEFPPRSTVFDYFARWQADGTLGRIHSALYVRCREQAKRSPTPTADREEGKGTVRKSTSDGVMSNEEEWKLTVVG